MPLPNPVSLADVLLSFAVLKPETDEAKKGIAQALGFEYQPEEPKPESVETDATVGVESPHG